LKNSLRTVW